jgi:hypothetical protein
MTYPKRLIEVDLSIKRIIYKEFGASRSSVFILNC